MATKECENNAAFSNQAACEHKVEPPGKLLCWPALVLVGVFLLNAWQSLRCFPTWGSIFDDGPIIQVDHALHLYHGYLGAKFLRAHGSNWGYDPYFMAGYPKTPFHDPSSGLAELSQLAVGGGYSPAAYKVGLLITLLLAPILYWIAARWLEIEASAIAAALCLWLWEAWAGFAHILLDSGLYSFLWSGGWIALVLAATAQWHREPSIISWLRLSTVTAFALFVHPTVAPILMIPLALFYVVVSWRHGWKWHAALAAAVAIVMGANYFWIEPMIRFWPIKQAAFTFMATAPNDYSFVFRYYKISPLPLCLLILGAAGLVVWARQGRWLLLGTTGVVIVELFALTFFGSAWEVTRGLEPLRFRVPLALFLCLPAGQTIISFLHFLQRRTTRIGFRVGIAIATAIPFVAILSRGGEFTRSYREVVRRRPFPIGLAPEMFELVDWINANADNSARIMLEDQLRLLEPTVKESLHWTCLLPVLTGRQFIGGQYHTAPLPHNHASLGDFHLGGKPIENYSAAELLDFLRRYHVRWVMCWSEKSRQALGRLPHARLVKEIPRHTDRLAENRYFIYEIEADPNGSFFLAGRGTVAAIDYNRIVLENVVPENGVAVIRCHWLETFATDPPLPVERFGVANDPVGFIAVKLSRPLERLVIENSYSFGRARNE